MEFIKRDTKKHNRNGDVPIHSATTIISNGSTGGSGGNYLPAIDNGDGTYTVDLSQVTFNGNLISTGEVSAYGAGTSSGTGAVTVYDGLDSTASDVALSANQGRILKSLIDNIDVGDIDLSGYYNKSEIDNTLKNYSKTNHSHSITDVTNLQTTLDAKATSTDLITHTGDSTIHITDTERINWNDAYTNKHSHSNKSVLDEITSTKVSNWDSVYSDWTKVFTINSDGDLKIKVNVIGEKEISAYGAGTSSGGNSGVDIVDALTSTRTDAALSANQGRVIKNLIDNFDTSGYLPKTGGELTGNEAITLKIKTSLDNAAIEFINTTNRTSIGTIGEMAYINLKDSSNTSLSQLQVYRDSLKLYIPSTYKTYDIIHSGNYNYYALPINGGKMNGDITLPKGIYIRGDNTNNYAILGYGDDYNVLVGAPVYTLSLRGSSIDVGTVTKGIWNGSKITNEYLNNSTISICGSSISLGGSITQATLRSGLGLGSNAYTSTAFLPLTGGKLSNTLTFKSNSTVTAIDSEGVLVIATDSIRKIAVDSIGLFPVEAQNKMLNLGSPSNYWKDLYLSGSINSDDSLDIQSPTRIFTNDFNGLTIKRANNTGGAGIMYNPMNQEKYGWMVGADSEFGFSFYSTTDSYKTTAAVAKITLEGKAFFNNGLKLNTALEAYNEKGITFFKDSSKVGSIGCSDSGAIGIYPVGSVIALRPDYYTNGSFNGLSVEKGGVTTIVSDNAGLHIKRSNAGAGAYVQYSSAAQTVNTWIGGMTAAGNFVWQYSTQSGANWTEKLVLYNSGTLKAMSGFDLPLGDTSNGISYKQDNIPVLRNNGSSNGGVTLLSGYGGIYFRPKGTYVTDGQAILNTEGELSLGSTTPTTLTINRTDTSGGAYIRYNGGGQTTFGWIAGSSADSTFTWQYYNGTGYYNKATLDKNGNLIAYGEVTAHSDRRLKSNIKPLTVRGELNPVTYTKDGKQCIGFIADEVQELYSELVTVDNNTDEKYLSLNYAQLTAVLYAEIKELKERITKLENK